jgi:hypothetical protein
VHRRRSDHASALAPQIDAGANADAVVSRRLARREVQMPTTGGGSGPCARSSSRKLSSPPCRASMSTTTSPETRPVTMPTLASGQRANHAAISRGSAMRCWNSSHGTSGRLPRGSIGIGDQPRAA